MTIPARVALIIPTLNEAGALAGIMRDLDDCPIPAEVIVSDGGSSDDTVRVARALGAIVVEGRRGRARQMNRGAAAAEAAWLCFLHADSRMSHDARGDMIRVVQGEVVADAAVWRLGIDQPGGWYRLIERAARWRHRAMGMAYGDQGLLVRRSLFDEVGGFEDIPIMEDIGMMRSLTRRGQVHTMPSVLVTSARRWQREGRLRCTARNVILASAYLAGVSPTTLVRWYGVDAR